jgi:hypothetical protein
MVPFTYVSGLIFLFYLITKNPYIGSVSLNCAIGVLLGFKSAILIDNTGYNKCVDEMIKYHQITHIQFIILDSLMHWAPVVYYVFNINDVYNIKYLNPALLSSVSIQLIWAVLACRGLNLNAIYLAKCEYQLCDRQWHKMWACAFIGHSVPHIYYHLL